MPKLPIIVMDADDDDNFAAAAKIADGMLVRGSLADAVRGSFPTFDHYAGLAPKGLPVHVALSAMPYPASYPGLQVKEKTCLAWWQQQSLDMIVKAHRALAQHISSPLLGARICPSVVKAGDAEFGMYGWSDPAAVQQWIAGGWTPALQAEGLEYLTGTMGSLFPLYSLAALDPTAQAKAFSDSAIGWVQAAARGNGNVGYVDTNLGEHPVSDFAVQAAGETGTLGVQMHAGQATEAWWQNVVEAIPNWVELRPTQILALRAAGVI